MLAENEEERRALLSVANDESLADYAEGYEFAEAYRAVKRMRFISKLPGICVRNSRYGYHFL